MPPLDNDTTLGEKQNTTELYGPDLLHQRLSEQVCRGMRIDPIVLSSHGGDRVTEISVLRLGAVSRPASAMAGEKATKGQRYRDPGWEGLSRCGTAATASC